MAPNNYRSQYTLTNIAADATVNTMIIPEMIRAGVAESKEDALAQIQQLQASLGEGDTLRVFEIASTQNGPAVAAAIVADYGKGFSRAVYEGFNDRLQQQGQDDLRTDSLIALQSAVSSNAAASDRPVFFEVQDTVLADKGNAHLLQGAGLRKVDFATQSWTDDNSWNLVAGGDLTKAVAVLPDSIDAHRKGVGVEPEYYATYISDAKNNGVTLKDVAAASTVERPGTGGPGQGHKR